MDKHKKSMLDTADTGAEQHVNPHPDAWRRELSAAFTDLASLCRYLRLDLEQLPTPAACREFPLKVPREFAARMHGGDPSDPLLRQVLLSADEFNPVPGYSADPVGDLDALAAPGLIHKYHGRVLLVVTGACAVHCRYCFRRHFPYQEQQLSRQNLEPALTYIRAHADISEVILSGGDPLMLGDAKLAALLHQLRAIPHLRRIRIHSRMPVVLPMRVTASLLHSLAAAEDKTLVMVLHANHAAEINTAVAEACTRLKQAGVGLFNQSVLLKGVNDTAAALEELSERLYASGVQPYYLHQLDKIQGAAHFAVDPAAAAALMDTVRRRLPGYLVPRLVREKAGAGYKLPL